jgi:hypothetical protein
MLWLIYPGRTTRPLAKSPDCTVEHSRNGAGYLQPQSAAHIVNRDRTTLFAMKRGQCVPGWSQQKASRSYSSPFLFWKNGLDMRTALRLRYIEGGFQEEKGLRSETG